MTSSGRRGALSRRVRAATAMRGSGESGSSACQSRDGAEAVGMGEDLEAVVAGDCSKPLAGLCRNPGAGSSGPNADADRLRETVCLLAKKIGPQAEGTGKYDPTRGIEGEKAWPAHAVGPSPIRMTEQTAGRAPPPAERRLGRALFRRLQSGSVAWMSLTLLHRFLPAVHSQITRRG
jgi:hypothetical protein